MPFLPPNQQRQSTEGTTTVFIIMHILWYQINGSVALRLALLWPCLSGVVTSRCSCLGEVLITALAQSSSGGIAVCTSSFIGMTLRWHITANGPIYKISNSLSWNLLGAKFWWGGGYGHWPPFYLPMLAAGF